MILLRNYPSTWAEIDLKALRHNFGLARKLAGKNIRIIAVVKADAYGHGMIPVAKELNRLGVEFFGVSNVGEGIALRQAGIKRPIVLFENPLPEFAGDIVKYSLTPMLCTMELAQALNAAARRVRKTIDVHIKVDTGMGRLGVWHEEVASFVKKVNQFASLRVSGVATHFPVADTDPNFTKHQFLFFQSTVYSLWAIVPPTVPGFALMRISFAI